MSNSEIDEQAADWVAKMDAGRLTPEERRAFEAWLSADIRHLGAFAKTAAAVASLDPLHSIGGGEVRRLCNEASACARRQSANGIETSAWTRRRLAAVGGGAVTLAAASLAGILVWRRNPQLVPTATNSPASVPVNEYATKVGARRVVALSDGSVVVLNTNSRVMVKLTERLREVQLVHGDALFNVAKDGTRPFIVIAGNVQVRAVGTCFTVSFLEKRPIRVLVQEGTVEVTRPKRVDIKPVLASANTEALVSRNAPIAMRSLSFARIARDTAWQYGQISFDNETLGDAAHEFARYSETRIVVEPSVADRTITGLYPSNDPIGFAKAAAAALGLRVVSANGEIQIIR